MGVNRLEAHRLLDCQADPIIQQQSFRACLGTQPNTFPQKSPSFSFRTDEATTKLTTLRQYAFVMPTCVLVFHTQGVHWHSVSLDLHAVMNMNNRKQIGDVRLRIPCISG